MTAIFAFLKLIPWRTWAEIGGALALVAAVMAYNSHERDIGRQQSAAQIATLQSQLALAQAANDSAGTAIKALQDKLAECEKGRLVDKAAQDDAQKAYAASLAVLKAKDSAAHQRTQALLAGDCKAWAAQAACGVSTMP